MSEPPRGRLRRLAEKAYAARVCALPPSACRCCFFSGRENSGAIDIIIHKNVKMRSRKTSYKDVY